MAGTGRDHSTLRDLILFGLTALASMALSGGSRAAESSAARKAPRPDGGGSSSPDSVAAEEEEELRRSLADGTSRDAAERVCTVTENNVPTADGHPRSEVRLKNLWHRATYIVVRHEEEDAADDDGEGAEEGKKESSSSAGDGDGDVRVLVQRRSKLKDYCPGRLDPAPGGVVGFGESCEENARRELLEEMGIDAPLRRMFAFPYEDGRVRCWGELYEATYRGPIDALRIQEEEVDEVLSLSLSEIESASAAAPGGWLPDGLHALRLYVQRRRDASVPGRRLLPGYSSGDLDAYRIRPRPRAVFFDCDDCLYFDGWAVAGRLTDRIERWCVERAGLPEGEAYRLYRRHGTALRGLLAEGHMERCDRAIDEYLRYAHDLPISSMLRRDEELRGVIGRMDPSVPRYVFTASVRHHAERCLRALGIEDLFEGIIDVRDCGLATKHSTEAFEAAMRIAGVEDPESCVFLDDSVKNICAAREMGWRSVLVGRIGRDCGKAISTEHAEHEIDRIHEMPSVLPELFDY